MDERIKQIFQRRLRKVSAQADNMSDIRFKSIYTYAAYIRLELIELFSEVCGISYDTAASELCESNDEGDEC